MVDKQSLSQSTSTTIVGTLPHWRVLFWGTYGLFSQVVLTELYLAGVQLCGVIVPGDGETAVSPPIQSLKPKSNPSTLPLLNPFVNKSILQVAWTKDIPVFAVNDLTADETQKTIRSLQPELACVACFNKRIPPALLTIPTRGFWNLHPSLLPDYRGPTPLFWMLRAGIQNVGVTIHQMDENFDTGDILLQTAFKLNDGIRGPEADEVFAKQGSGLLLAALQGVAEDKIVPKPQPTGGSYFSWPQTDDFQIPTTWSARHAFNFMRGTAEWKQPFHIYGPDSDITARFAIEFDPEAKIKRALKWNGRDVTIQFNPGTLHVTT